MTVKIFTATAALTVAASVLLGLAGPTHATSGTMYGDPSEAAEYWHEQKLDDDCVEVSVSDVVGE